MMTFLLSAALSLAPVSAPAKAPARQSVTSESAAAAICPVDGNKVAEGKGVKATVHDREYTVCNAACAAELKKNPDKYLEADGTPKNSKKL